MKIENAQISKSHRVQSYYKKNSCSIFFADIISAPTVQKAALDSEGNEFAELSKRVRRFLRNSVRGVYNEDDTFEMEYYYPYLCGKNISTIEPAEVEKHAEKESYAGICDEVRIGVTLIFLSSECGGLSCGQQEQRIYESGSGEIPEPTVQSGWKK